MVTKYRRGFPIMEFVKTRERNEALDCLAYAYAALDNLNVKLAALASKRATKHNAAIPAEPEKSALMPTEKPTRKRTTRSRKKGNYVTRLK
jgi:phage terminase large subunit GpA-like protein